MQTETIKRAKEIRLFPHQAKAIASKKRFIALVGGTGGGKALHVETLIPTIAGFKKMLDIEVGDIIFDSMGQRTRVTYASPVYLGHKCYKIIFDDGSEIIADAEHRWVVQTAKQRKNVARWKNNPKRKPYNKKSDKTIISTEKMSQAVNMRGRANYSIDLVTIQQSARKLSIPPYVLGDWLGDGTAAYAVITTMDKEIIENIKADGIPVGHEFGFNSGKAKNYRLSSGEKISRKDNGQYSGKETVNNKLRQLGVLNNKHIPQEYLFSSFKQRLALLQGLMDTDGSIRQDGICEFSSSNIRLINDVSSLLSGLGIKNRVTHRSIRAFNKKFSTFRMKFKTNLSIFRLKRKSERIKEKIRPSAKRRFIKEIITIDSVPVKCISVDSPKETYLCKENFVVTHNTFTGPIWLYQEISKYPKEQFLVIAPTYKMLTRATAPTLIDIFRGTQAEGEYKPSLGQYVLPTGGIIWFGSADRPETLEAGQYRAAWLDESGQMKYQVWVVIQARLGQKLGRALLTTTPYAMNWLYSEFYKRYKQNEPDYEVINFRSIDNPLYPKEEYERVKATLDPRLFEMRYQGQFRKMEGLVYPDFDSNCIVDDFEIPKDWVRVAGMDFGFHNPMVVEYGALDNDDVLYIYKEIYRRGSLLSDIASKMDKDIETFPDPSGKQQVEELINLGIDMGETNNDVDMGIERVNGRIRTGRLKVFRSCRYILDEFETYHWQEGKDKPFKENDHCLDALRYLVMGIGETGDMEIMVL